MPLRDYNKTYWEYKGKNIPVNEMEVEHVLDFFITTCKLVNKNKELHWFYDSKLHSRIIDRSKELLTEYE